MKENYKFVGLYFFFFCLKIYFFNSEKKQKLVKSGDVYNLLLQALKSCFIQYCTSAYVVQVGNDIKHLYFQ